MSVPPATSLRVEPGSGKGPDGPWREDSDPQLILVTDGALRLETPHHRAVVPSNHAAWLPPGHRHRYGAGRQVDAYSLVLPLDHIERYAPTAQPEVVVFLAPALLREMIHEAALWDDPGHPPEEIVAAFLLSLCGLLDGWWGKIQPVVLPTGISPELRRALAHMLDNLDGPVGLSDAAGAAGVSERTLQRRCRSEMDLALSSWLTRARILSSVEKLSEEGVAVADVALACGYQSAAAFTRAFSNLMGSTPSSWRSRY